VIDPQHRLVMKHIPVFLSLILALGLISCSKETMETPSEFAPLTNRSSVTVNVTHQIWSDEAPTQECLWSDGLTYIYFVEGAVVSISRTDQMGIDDAGFANISRTTNRSGSITFSDLATGSYTLIVKTDFAEQTKVVEVYDNVQSLINFRF
jgi:hypothetical protein